MSSTRPQTVRALNVKVMKFKQARINGGSNYDSRVYVCVCVGTCVHAKSHGPAIFFRGLWGASGAPTVHNLLTEAVQVVREGPAASGFFC